MFWFIRASVRFMFGCCIRDRVSYGSYAQSNNQVAPSSPIIYYYNVFITRHASGLKTWSEALTRHSVYIIK